MMTNRVPFAARRTVPSMKAAEALELLVDLDAQGLEGLGRGMDASPLRPPSVDPFDEDPEVAGHLEPAELAQVDDLPGQPAGLGELAVVREHLGQLLLRVGLEDLRGRGLHPLVHPHVQRPLVHVAEPALWGIQLEGGDAEVDEDAADLLEGNVEIGQVLEIGLEERDPLGVGSESFPGDLEGLPVAVQADQAGPGILFEEDQGVTGQPQGAVDVGPLPPGVKEFDDFGGQDRAVSVLRHSGFPRGMRRAMLSKSSSESGFSSRVPSRTSLFQISR